MTDTNPAQADDADKVSQTERKLASLRAVVVDARNVPMSASCMVNRAEIGRASCRERVYLCV